MRVDWYSGSVELLEGDITRQEVDAIVNAANSRLAGGGGVDGAIHRCGGPTIMQETNRAYPDGCSTGSAVITSAGNLSSRYVIHAVGPVWNEGQRGEPELLASAYGACLRLATKHDCNSIAFPSLSTGAYAYPMAAASEIAISVALNYLVHNHQPSLIRFVLFGKEACETFRQSLAVLAKD